MPLDARLAIDGVCTGQERTGRLAAQYVNSIGSAQPIGGIGLPTLELLDSQRTGIIGNVALKPFGQTLLIEPVRFPHRHRAGILLCSIHMLRAWGRSVVA